MACHLTRDILLNLLGATELTRRLGRRLSQTRGQTHPCPLETWRRYSKRLKYFKTSSDLQTPSIFGTDDLPVDHISYPLKQQQPLLEPQHKQDLQLGILLLSSSNMPCLPAIVTLHVLLQVSGLPDRRPGLRTNAFTGFLSGLSEMFCSRIAFGLCRLWAAGTLWATLGEKSYDKILLGMHASQFGSLSFLPISCKCPGCVP